MEGYQVSVAVLTYNPDPDQLVQTLRSILTQKNISVQIVIADDGSKAPQYEAAEQFLAQQGFTDYVYVKNPTNRGTVCNTLSAVSACTGTYTKLISPGDFLAEEDTLSRWYACMESSGASLSFCEAVYYVPDQTGIRPVARYAHPQYLRSYQKGKLEDARYRYLILDDLFLGAATMCTTDLLKTYLQQIDGKVIYAEDNIYRLMAYDRVPVCYFPCCGIYYETDSGVSTGANPVWQERLQKDWKATDALLLSRCTGRDPIDKYLKNRFALPAGSKKEKLLRYLRIPKTFSHRLHRKFNVRLSPIPKQR